MFIFMTNNIDKELVNDLEAQSEKFEQDQQLRNDVRFN